MIDAKHTPSPWMVAFIPTRSGMTFGLERFVPGSGIAQPMRGPLGRELRFRSQQAAEKRGASA